MIRFITTALIAVTLLGEIGCARRIRRFDTLQVPALNVPSGGASEPFPGYFSLEQAVLRAFLPPEYFHQRTTATAPLEWQPASHPLITFPGTPYLLQARYSTFNVSVRNAPPSPSKSAYFDSSADAQAEIVKLFRLNANGRTSEDALKALFTALFKAEQESKLNPLQARVETTYSHVLNSLAEWSRHVYVASFLILHDEDVAVEDTNQLESVIRDLELGSLVQNSSIGAEIGGKRTDARVVGSVLPDVWELTPKATGSMSEALTRNLREQLLQRGSSIEADGRVFRLTQRGGGQMALPTMLRQILTLRYKATALPATVVNLASDGAVTVERGQIPRFAGARTLCNSPEPIYSIKATPVFFSVVRTISNEKGARSLAYDDDDHARLQVELDRRQPVELRAERVRHETIVAKRKGGTTWGRLQAKSMSGDYPGMAVLPSTDLSARFAELLKQRIRAATAADLATGNLFRNYLGGSAYDRLEFGFNATGSGAGAILSIPADLDVDTIQPQLVMLGTSCP